MLLCQLISVALSSESRRGKCWLSALSSESRREHSSHISPRASAIKQRVHTPEAAALGQRQCLHSLPTGSSSTAAKAAASKNGAVHGKKYRKIRYAPASDSAVHVSTLRIFDGFVDKLSAPEKNLCITTLDVL